MTSFRRRSYEIEAVQWTGKNEEELKKFFGALISRMDRVYGSLYLENKLDSLQVPMKAWIIGKSIGFVWMRDEEFRGKYELIEPKYKVGTKVQWIDGGYLGVVIPNYKMPGDICVLWDNGQKSSYDEEWLDTYTRVLS